ncbi:MAG: lipopolysaccharide biosynthesis protein [Clostridia bacterium]|nr:lipopolysaccharide biosynthesis protein [Clostridia bacterium]
MAENSANLKSKAFGGAFWSFSERVGAQLVSMVVTIVLARLLMPDDYAVVGIVTIFFTVANVLISGGLNTALIQKKDSTPIDFSTILITSLGVSLFIYLLLFFTSPLIADIYGIALLVPVIRVMGVVLIINAYKSILTAYIANTMQFKKMFTATISATLVSAAVGIAMAAAGCGVWALVAQQMINAAVGTAALFISTKFRVPFIFSKKSFKELFGYGWKIFVSSLISVIYDEINPLIVGLKFTAADLSFYTKGKSFPSMLNTTIGSTLSTVLFPVMSKVQDDKESLLAITRRYIQVASYLVFPLMCGFFAVSESFVALLLTEKWMPAVPFIQIFCISYMFDVINVGNLQTIKAIGRSDISLIMEIAKKSSYFAVILAFVFFSPSPQVLAVSSIVCVMVALIINTIPNRKLIGYRLRYQLADILPNFMIAVAMGAAVWAMNALPISPLALLPMQIVAGAAIYVALSLATANKNFQYLCATLKGSLRRKANA